MSNPEITIYCIPGPEEIINGFGKSLYGGWAYAIKNLSLLGSMNKDTSFVVVLLQLDSWGMIPQLPALKNISWVTEIVNSEDLPVKYKNQSSSQHGGLLNLALKRYPPSTRFFAILDPDNFIVMKNAFSILINKMKIENLAIIGISYPERLPKSYYWDFPTAYFQLFDRNLIDPKDLDFIPDESLYVPNDGHPGGMAFKHTGAYSLNFPFFVSLKKIAIRFYYFSYKYPLFLQIYHIIFFRFRAYSSTLVRDTGWKNREKFHNMKFEVIPFIIRWPKLPSLFFSTNSYLLNNIDVSQANIDAASHFFMHGFFEDRNFGKKNLHFKILQKVLVRKPIAKSYFPATNLIELSSPLIDLCGQSIMGNLRNAFWYSFNGSVFCVHLGHSGKNNPARDSKLIDALLILQESESE